MLTRLRVGAMEYEIVMVPRLQFKGEIVSGHISHDGCVIEVDADLAAQVRGVTVWHEVLHAIMIQAGLSDHDEALIEALSYGILGALKDNPELQDVVAHV